MHKTSRQSLLELGMWTDLAICLAGLLLASGAVTKPFWRKDVWLISHPCSQILLLLALLCGWHMSLVGAGLYQSFRLASRLERVASVLKASGLSTVCTGLWLELHIVASGGAWTLTRSIGLELLLFACGASLLLFSSRAAATLLTRSLRRRGRNLRSVLIVGTNRRAVRIAGMLTGDRALGYRLVGFVDDYWHSSGVPSAYTGMLVGTLAEFGELLRTLALDEVIIALPIASSYTAIQRICEECSRQGILVRCEASLFDRAAERWNEGEAPLQLITLHQCAWDQSAMAAKRSLDVAVALCALLLTAPAMLCIGTAVKLSSPGPIFFCQERLGLGKRIFKMYKFRTMVRGAEHLLPAMEHLNQSEGPTFKLREDPRVTPVGSILRKTSLDELPQLINVLLGDMSLVGPRPLPLRDYRGFSEDWHRRRFSVKPGITCLWQVMGRSTLGFDRWMELDMTYIDTWSFWLDLKILLQTIPVVLRGSGAM